MGYAAPGDARVCGGPMNGMAPMGQFPVPVVGDAALKDVSMRAFEHVWPTMEERLDAKLKRERWVTLGMTGVGMAGYFVLLWAVGVKLPWQRKW